LISAANSRSASPLATEFIGHRNRKLGRLFVARHDIAGFTDDSLCPAFHGREHEGDVDALIDPGQCLQSGFGKLVERHVKTQSPRRRRQAANEGLQGWRVVRTNLSQHDGPDVGMLSGRQQVERGA